jgi:tRNA pseudouridine13 synthase
MRIKRLPEDFRVEERIRFPGDSGAFAYYRVEKEGLTTMSVRHAMAERLKVTPSALVFPALKDKSAITIQYASVRKNGPEEMQGKGFVARRVGWGPRALRPRDLDGNQFEVVIRDLTEADAHAFGVTMAQLEVHGLPNYFDDQRFGSLTPEGFIGKEILKRDAEQVVRMYLSKPMVGDPREIRQFKRLVSAHWGEWGFLLHQAPRPSNFRSVITYLKDHPNEYRKAANLIQDRLLSIYLAAYQSWVWNMIVGDYLEQTLAPAARIRVMRGEFPIPEPSEAMLNLKTVLVELPRPPARYEGDFEAVSAAVFEKEQLELREFKARILRRVYLTKGERPVAFAPSDVSSESPAPDDQHPGRWQVRISFGLEAGQYATLVLKSAAALIGSDIRVR